MNGLAAFSLGFLSSAHCVGMCGGFAAMVGLSRRSTGDLVARQLLYSAGRVATYGFLGAVAGFGGQAFSQYRLGLVSVQQVFSILAGVAMLAVAAAALGLIPARAMNRLGIGSLFAPVFCHFFQGGGRWDVFVGGLINGFLPCGLVYAFLAQAVAAGTMAEGAAIMLAFGLGTMPAMLATGWGATLVSGPARARVFRVAACVMMLAGAVSIYRALPKGEGKSCCSHGEALATSINAEPLFK